MAAAATVPVPIFKSNPALQKWSRDGGKGWLKIPLADNRYSFKVLWGDNDYVVGLECRSDVSESRRAPVGFVRDFTLAQVLDSKLSRKFYLADGSQKMFRLRKLFMQTFSPLQDFGPFQVATKTYPAENTLRLLVDAVEGTVQVDGLLWMTQSARQRRQATTAGPHNNNKGAQKAIVMCGLFEYPDSMSAANPAIAPSNFHALDLRGRAKLETYNGTCKRKLQDLHAPTRKRKLKSMANGILNCARKRRLCDRATTLGFKATFDKRYLEEQDPLHAEEQLLVVPGQEGRAGKKQTISNMGRVKTGLGNHISFGSDESHGSGYMVFGCNGNPLSVHRGVLQTFAAAAIADFQAANPGVAWKGDHIDRHRNHNCIKNLRVVTVAQNNNNASSNLAPLPTFPPFCDFCGFKRGAMDSIQGTVARTAAERTANIARLYLKLAT